MTREQPPAVLIFDRDQNVEVFESPKAAASYVEAIDVEFGEYSAFFTHDGRVVTCRIDGDSVRMTVMDEADPGRMLALLSQRPSFHHELSIPGVVNFVNGELAMQWEQRWPKWPTWLDRRLHGRGPAPVHARLSPPRLVPVGYPVPSPAETVALLAGGIILTDRLPDLAAQWLASDEADTPLVRQLAGEPSKDLGGIRDLWTELMANIGLSEPSDEDRASIVTSWIIRRWQADGGTRNAVRSLAGLAWEFTGLGDFASWDDAWDEDWAGSPTEIEAFAAARLSEMAAAPDER